MGKKIWLPKRTDVHPPLYASQGEILHLKHCALAQMADMAINGQNHHTVNKNSNEMAKGPFVK